MQALSAIGAKLRRRKGAPPIAQALEATAPTDILGNCARAVTALLFGTLSQRMHAIAELAPFGHCDPGWIGVVASYFRYRWFGGRVPYSAPSDLGTAVFDTLPEKCRIGVIGDWGTGTEPAERVLEQVQRWRQESADSPFVLIHLGDIYYSGTAHECDRFASQIRRCFPDESVFTLCGNHDMYSGGRGYYRCIGALNPPPNTQRTSYFSLRNRYWQFQAMDTGLHDRDPFDVSSNLTFLEAAEVAWHRRQLKAAEPRKTVLLSHHQPFSAFYPVGCDDGGGDIYVNHRLLGTLDGTDPADGGENLLPRVCAWLFGHEHNTIIYEPFAGVQKARCVGSSAVPTDPADGDPYAVAYRGIPWNTSARLSISDGLYSHGYAIIDLDRERGRARYFQFPAAPDRELLYEEDL